MSKRLFDWLSDWPFGCYSFMDEFKNAMDKIAKDALAIDEITTLEHMGECENGIHAKYIVDSRDVNTTEKCDEILSKWEDVAKLLKDDTEIVVEFPQQDTKYSYNWDAKQGCFNEKVEGIKNSAKKIDDKVESKDFKKIEIKDGEKKEIKKEDCGELCFQLNPEYKRTSAELERYPEIGDVVNIEDYTFVSRYGSFYEVTDGNRWNFLMKDDRGYTVVGDEWYKYASDFHNNYCLVGQIIDGKMKYSVLNHSLDRIIDWYDWIDETVIFSDGWCLVCNEGKKFYFVNEEGDKIGPFKAACKFYHGFAPVQCKFDDNDPKHEGKWNFIDVNGDYISDTWFDYVNKFEGFLAEVVLDGKERYIDMNGKLMFTPINEQVKNMELPSGCKCTECDVTVNEEKTVAENLKDEISKSSDKSRYNIIVDETDDRLQFVPKSAISILKDLINAKDFNILDNDEGISVSIGQLIAEAEDDVLYNSIVNEIKDTESLMLDRFCKYAVQDLGFSKVTWNGVAKKPGQDILDIEFKLFF